MDKNLNKIVIKTATKWKERAKQDRANRRNISRAQAFAMELMDYMDLNNIKQNELAERMGVTAQQVNKILRAKSNLTFDTLDKIADALVVEISSPKIVQTNRTISAPVIHSKMKIIYRKKPLINEEVVSSENIMKRNPILTLNMENMNSYQYTANQI